MIYKRHSVEVNPIQITFRVISHVGNSYSVLLVGHLLQQSETLREMVSASETTITVIRDGGEVELVSTTDLVPGDVIVVPAHGCTMTCDGVLVSGNAIVNESMLTGG